MKALRRIGARQASDERILGSGKFVEQVTTQVDLEKKYRILSTDRLKKATQLIEESCKQASISVEALKGGSRLRDVSRMRAEISVVLVREQGLTLAESARQLGASTSAIAKIIRRKENK